MRYFLITFLSLVLISGCSEKNKKNNFAAENLDIQGHRGCRGLLPENSITGFLKALELGVTTLEMDVVISKDHQVLLSHEPFISHVICRDTTGASITPADAQLYNIYQMTYAQIRKFDCGSAGHPDFLEQKGVASHKPLLAEVFQAVSKRQQELGLSPVKYNIETKTSVAGDSLFHPLPLVFVQLLLDEITRADVLSQTTIQSFDPRTLRVVKNLAPEINLALLVENRQSLEENLANLGFYPQIYSPNHTLVDTQLIQALKTKDIKLVPWTINEEPDMIKYLEMGVDGIITDYPDRLLHLLED